MKLRCIRNDTFICGCEVGQIYEIDYDEASESYVAYEPDGSKWRVTINDYGYQTMPSGLLDFEQLYDVVEPDYKPLEEQLTKRLGVVSGEFFKLMVAESKIAFNGIFKIDATGIYKYTNDGENFVEDCTEFIFLDSILSGRIVRYVPKKMPDEVEERDYRFE